MIKRWNGAVHLPAISSEYNTVLGFNEPYNHNEDPETIAYAWLKVTQLSHFVHEFNKKPIHIK